MAGGGGAHSEEADDEADRAKRLYITGECDSDGQGAGEEHEEEDELSTSDKIAQGGDTEALLSGSSGIERDRGVAAAELKADEGSGIL